MSEKEKYLQETKNLYVKYCETFQLWVEIKPAPRKAKKTGVKLGDLQRIALDFEESAEKLLALPNYKSSEKKLFTIMLAYAQNAKGEWMCENPILIDDAVEIFENTIKMLEPYAFHLMGAYPRLFACHKVVELCDRSKGFDANNKICEFGNQVYIDENFVKVLTGDKFFQIPDYQQSARFTKYQITHSIVAIISESCNKEKEFIEENRNKSIKFLKTCPTPQEITEKIKTDDFKQMTKALSILIEMIDANIGVRRYKQALHLLAISMHHCVKIRRNLQPDDRYKMNQIQAAISYRFSNFGFQLVQGTLAMLQKHYNYEPEKNEYFYEMPDLIESGFEIYSSQFPIEYPKTYSDAKKVMKKTINWSDRAIELVKNEYNATQYKEYRTGLDNMVNIIDSLVATEKAK